ncbi:tetratricopeptide repeat protein [Motilimonas pumila]|uniref:Tetratricopeptide repeat protein n=1 Tax=Motilimonas pumila TaxID=2303987 RepID=A0A418YAG6_9GAMM|nr:tetratricopeptide repeat protein [Motilimonas pumila]RJG39520.1 tetratricopeptide repeat protein [Motilimonas pumila]
MSFLKFFSACFISFILMSCTTHVEVHSQLNENVDKEVFKKLQRADSLYSDGRLADAEAAYLSIVKKYKNYGYAWFKLGNIYIRTKQYNAAVLSYEKAVKSEPDNYKAWNNLALARTKQAISVIEEAEEVFPAGTPEHSSLQAFKRVLLNASR